MSSQKSKEMNLKGPDVFQAKVGDFLAGLAQNPKPIFAVIGLLLVDYFRRVSCRAWVVGGANRRRRRLCERD